MKQPFAGLVFDFTCFKLSSHSALLFSPRLWNMEFFEPRCRTKTKQIELVMTSIVSKVADFKQQIKWRLPGVGAGREGMQQGLNTTWSRWVDFAGAGEMKFDKLTQCFVFFNVAETPLQQPRTIREHKIIWLNLCSKDRRLRRYHEIGERRRSGTCRVDN